MKTRILPLLSIVLATTTATMFTGCAGTTGKSTGEYIDDAALTTKVKAEFIRDPVVKAREINVDTNKAIVSLNGTVDTADQKARAEQIARSVPGVQGVQDNLTIRGQTTP